MEAWLEIRGLTCRGRHGAYEEERGRERLYCVDLRLRTDVARAAETDDLNDAVDFAALSATVQEVVGGSAQALLETVAVRAARLVLDRFPQASAVWLRLGKSYPPGLDAAEEAVEILLHRAEENPSA